MKKWKDEKAQRAIERFSNPELNNYLEENGLVDNPTLTRMFSNTLDLVDGRVTAEELDNMVSGDPSIPGVIVDE